MNAVKKRGEEDGTSVKEQNEEKPAEGGGPAVTRVVKKNNR